MVVKVATINGLRLPQAIRTCALRATLLLVLLGAMMGALPHPLNAHAVRGLDIGLPSPFQLAPNGCAMAHCDPQLSDLTRMTTIPTPTATLQWHDPVQGSDGSSVGSPGLGCSSNSSTVACSFGVLPAGYPTTPCNPALQDLVIAYGDAGPNGLPYRKWGSGTLLDCTAYISAPMISTDGNVIAADDRTVIRFDATGAPLWQTATPGGIPISPVITANGAIVLATYGGPISSYDNQTGAQIGVLNLIDGPDQYTTINTPGVQGNRVYVLAQKSVRPAWGRLIAIDVTLPAAYTPLYPSTSTLTQTLQVAWSVDVGGPGGASPTVVGNMIYFDGNRLTPGGAFAPYAFAVQDLGTSGQIAWVKPMPGRVQASFAVDPRGGVWVYTLDNPANPVNRFLMRLALQDLNGDGQGDMLDVLDLDTLLGEPGVYRPYSAMSIAGSAQDPIMLLTATPLDRTQPTALTFVVAIDLQQRSLLWKVPLPVRMAPAQFPITQGAYGTRVLFTSQGQGTWMIGGH